MVDSCKIHKVKIFCSEDRPNLYLQADSIITVVFFIHSVYCRLVAVCFIEMCIVLFYF